MHGLPGQIWDANSLPENDSINHYAFSVALNGEYMLQKGAMIAYYGNVTFEAVTSFSSKAGWVASRFSSPIYQQDWVVATGQGKVVLGDRGNDINAFTLGDDGEASALTIKATNLLAFESTLELKQSIVPGFLTLIGLGQFLASSNGPVIFVKPPFRADPEALLGWADCPSPSHHYDANWMAGSLAGMFQGMLGRESGEERQFDFTAKKVVTPGVGEEILGDILLQSSELTRIDPALERMVEAQSTALSNAQAGSLGQRLIARAQQQ